MFVEVVVVVVVVVGVEMSAEERCICTLAIGDTRLSGTGLTGHTAGHGWDRTGVDRKGKGRCNVDVGQA